MFYVIVVETFCLNIISKVRLMIDLDLFLLFQYLNKLIYNKFYNNNII
jgi:hypothetical protein